MALTISDSGEGNRIDIADDVLADSVGSIVLSGNDNEIVIEPGCLLLHGTIHLSDHCHLRIGRNCRLAQIEIWAAQECSVTIGEDTSFTWHTRILMHEPSSVSIGQRCLVASETLLMTSDMHTILDREGGKRINPARDVVIGDDVWLGGEVAVMKGAVIGAGSAIGFRSVVAGDVPSNCLAVGSPARVVRKRIAWRHELL